MKGNRLLLLLFISIQTLELSNGKRFPSFDSAFTVRMHAKKYEKQKGKKMIHFSIRSAKSQTEWFTIVNGVTCKNNKPNSMK